MGILKNIQKKKPMTKPYGLSERHLSRSTFVYVPTYFLNCPKETTERAHKDWLLDLNKVENIVQQYFDDSYKTMVDEEKKFCVDIEISNLEEHYVKKKNIWVWIAMV